MTSPLTPLISLRPVGHEINEEGEVDRMPFSVYNELLEGKNDVIVANMEADIAIDIIIIIMRRIVGRISPARICGYPDFIIKAKTRTKALFTIQQRLWSRNLFLAQIAKVRVENGFH